MKKLLATLLILCAGPVWAEWIFFNRSSIGDEWYVDPHSVRGSSIKKVWTRTEYNPPRKRMRSSRNLDEIDCQEQRIRNLQVSIFTESNLDGQPLGTISTPNEWSYIEPDSIHEILYKLVCGKK